MSDFVLVADEMIGLGVLAKAGNTYMMRSPNVSRLLGSVDDIEIVLADAVSIQPSRTFEPIRWRRDITGPAGGAPKRSPLTEAQLADLLANETQVRLVVGTAASGVGRVHDVLEKESERNARTIFMERSIAELNLDSALKRLGDGRHRVIVVNVDGNSALAVKSLDKILDTVGRRRNRPSESFSVILVADAVAQGEFVRHALLDPRALAEVPIVATQLWTADAITDFGFGTGLAFGTEARGLDVHGVTGGWDVLVHGVAAACAAGTTLDVALDQIKTDKLVGELRVRDDHVLEAAYRVAWGVIGSGAERQDVIDVLVSEEGSTGLEPGVEAACIDQMVLIGLVRDAGDGSIFVEPVAARAHNFVD